VRRRCFSFRVGRGFGEDFDAIVESAITPKEVLSRLRYADRLAYCPEDDVLLVDVGLKRVRNAPEGKLSVFCRDAEITSPVILGRTGCLMAFKCPCPARCLGPETSSAHSSPTGPEQRQSSHALLAPPPSPFATHSAGAILEAE